jgi:hypothetical protein
VQEGPEEVHAHLDHNSSPARGIAGVQQGGGVLDTEGDGQQVQQPHHTCSKERR